MRDTLTERLAAAARKWPGNVAVRHGQRTLTFAELDDLSGRLAGWLKRHGVTRGDRVGIALRRNLEMPIAVYGVMRAGAAYVPIDPQAPAERIHTIFKEAGVRIAITEEALRDRIVEGSADTGVGAILGLAGASEGLETAPFDAIADEIPFADDHGAEDISYIIFTSGSTGTPKGLTHTHRSALSFVDMASALFELGPQDRMAAVSGLHYDMSCMEMFAGLLSGSCIVMVPEAYAMMPASLSGLLESEAVTTLYTVPFMLIRLAEAGALEQRDLSALRLVVHAGEPMPPRPLAKLREHLPGTRFANFYGPAEVNGVTWWDHPDESTEPAAAFPIGWACSNATLLVDGPDGNEGELLIATPAMMRGYWGRSDLDAGAFVSLTGEDGVARRYYRSGDIVRRDSNGCYTYLGRADRQVKVRGFRVELDEIELALSGHPAVSEAAAILSEEGRRIAAFVLPVSGAHVDDAVLGRFASKRLSPHAVPSTITVVTELPRTSSGKIDRRRLSDDPSEKGAR